MTQSEIAIPDGEVQELGKAFLGYLSRELNKVRECAMRRSGQTYPKKRGLQVEDLAVGPG